MIINLVMYQIKSIIDMSIVRKFLGLVTVLIINLPCLGQKKITKTDLIGDWDIKSEKNNRSLFNQFVRFGEDGSFYHLRQSKCSDSLFQVGQDGFVLTDTSLIIVRKFNGFGGSQTNTITLKLPVKTKVGYRTMLLSSELYSEKEDTSWFEKPNDLWANILFIRRDKTKEVKPFCVDENAEWIYDFEKGYPTCNMVLDDGVLYFGSTKTEITKLDASTGKRIWESKVSLVRKGFIHPIASDKSYLYFNGTQGNLYKVSKETGELIWTYEARFDDDVLCNIAIHKELLYVNTVDKDLLVLDKDGELVWRLFFGSPISTFVISKNKLYGNLRNGELVVVDLKLKKMVKKIPLFSSSRGYYMSVVNKRTLILSNSNDSIVGLNVKTLKVKWTNENQILGLNSDGIIISNDRENNRLLRISPQTGETIWSIQASFGKKHLYSVLFDNKLYVQKSKRKFLVLNPKTGKILAISSLPFKTWTKPVITKEYMYLGKNGKVFKVKNPIY